MSHHAGLLQSLLVAVCLGLTMVLRLIPSAVLWGYFAFMALESLNGSQFWERLLYLVTDPAKRYRCASPPQFKPTLHTLLQSTLLHRAYPVRLEILVMLLEIVVRYSCNRSQA